MVGRTYQVKRRQRKRKAKEGEKKGKNEIGREERKCEKRREN